MRKLATLEVWEAEDNDIQDSPSALLFSSKIKEDGTGLDVKNKHYRLMLNPKFDKRVLPTADKLTIAAHELGHFLSTIFGTVESVMAHARFAAEPEERLAWKYAEKMGLPLDEGVKKVSLSSYQGK